MGISSISDRHTRFSPLIEKLAKAKPRISKVKLCELFAVARSTHYLAKKPKMPSLEQINLNLWVKQAYDQTKGSGGARTLSAIVSQQHNVKLTRYKASKIMAQQGLVSRQLIRHRYSKADKEHAIHDNLLKREFSPAAPNQVWTGDVTYIRTKQGWAYLAVVIDLYARNIVGFAVSDSPDSQLTAQALKMAYTVRLKPKNVLFHSDQGTHYTSKAYAEAVAQCTGMTHSMSRSGNSLRA